MTIVDPTEEMRRDMALSYNATPLVPTIPNAFALLADVVHFSPRYNHRAFEWRPSHYAVAGILANWGFPALCAQMLERRAYEMLVRKTTHGISLIQGRDVYILTA